MSVLNIPSQLAERLGAINKRTLIMIIALGALFGLVQIFNISDHLSVLRGEREALENRLAQYGDGLDLEEWNQRAQDLQTIDQQWSTLYWQGDSASIINSQIQSSLDRIARLSLLERPSKKVEPTIVDLPAGRAMRFDMTARSSDAVDLLTALTMLAENQPRLLVTSLTVNIRPDDSGIISVSGLAYIQITQNDVSGTVGPGGQS